MDEVRAVLAREFPGREPSSVTPTRQGNRKQTALVSFPEGDDVVIQLSSSPAALRMETALSRVVREHTSIPVPRVLATSELDGSGYVVVERAPGEDLHEQYTGLSSDEQRHVSRTLGRYLADLHETFAFDAYGEVVSHSVDGNDGFRATGSTDWPVWFTEYARAGVTALPSAFSDLRRPIMETIEQCTLPNRPPSRLFPWDFRPGNTLYADGEVTAVLDWEEQLAATPGLSVAKAEHLIADWYVSDGTPLRAAFREGYQEVQAFPPVLRAYRLAAVVHSAVDSQGIVTRPGFPEFRDDAAVAFHRDRLQHLLSNERR